MAERTDHRHCKVCGNVCAPERKFCSDRCERERSEALRSKKTLQTLMYASIAVLVVLFVLQLSHV